MLLHVLRRFAVSVLVVLGVVTITFFLLRMISPSPALVVLGAKASPAAVEAFNAQYGYDRPLFFQYVSYLGGLLTGDLGYSHKLAQSVTGLVGQYLGKSVFLSSAALSIAVCAAIPLGIFQAVHRKKPVDYAVTTLNFVLYSMPSFFLGIVLLQVFAITLNWLPAEASQETTTAGVVLDWRHMLLPVFTLAAIQLAGFSRYMRSSALDNLGQDYIRLARAKGLSERQLRYRHLLRNSSLPMITLVGLSLPALVAGSVVTESLFNYPGLGLLFFHSLQNQDYPVLLALTLLGAVLVVLGNFLADVVSAVADPRIRR
jgi:peptide/nickel transport system permease protein